MEEESPDVSGNEEYETDESSETPSAIYDEGEKERPDIVRRRSVKAGKDEEGMKLDKDKYPASADAETDVQRRSSINKPKHTQDTETDLQPRSGVKAEKETLSKPAEGDEVRLRPSFKPGEGAEPVDDVDKDTPHRSSIRNVKPETEISDRPNIKDEKEKLKVSEGDGAEVRRRPSVKDKEPKTSESVGKGAQQKTNAKDEDDKLAKPGSPENETRRRPSVKDKDESKGENAKEGKPETDKASPDVPRKPIIKAPKEEPEQVKRKPEVKESTKPIIKVDSKPLMVDSSESESEETASDSEGSVKVAPSTAAPKTTPETVKKPEDSKVVLNKKVRCNGSSLRLTVLSSSHLHFSHSTLDNLL